MLRFIFWVWVVYEIFSYVVKPDMPNVTKTVIKELKEAELITTTTSSVAATTTTTSIVEETQGWMDFPSDYVEEGVIE